ncbi:hypothetical protein ACFY3G_02615 [Streptomyces phaeochromogenes]|uniref:hypothetical protein n=1 Tax=Streptomyces phaeochromogenes TaxID=1923 RepID=UPI0036C583C5
MTRPIVEVAFGYSITSASPVWTDISRRVDVGTGIGIDRGAENELAETQGGTATLKLDNSDGALTPDRAASPYFPNVKKNVPIRISVATLDSPVGSTPWALEQLADDFDDDKINLALWSQNYGAPVEGNGRARVPCKDGVFAGYQSARSWRLWGTHVAVKIATLPVANGGSECTAGVFVNSGTDGTRMGIEYSAVTGQLRLVSDVLYFDAGATVLTYSPALHGWWRMREAGGSLFWETSADGHTWVVRRTLTTPAWVGTDVVTYSLEAHRAGGVDDFAEYEIVGATVQERFYGMVNNWPTEWKGLYATSTVNCSDVFKWADLEELLPMLSQEVLLDRPACYFPLTEPAESTSVGDLSGTAGIGTLSITQAGVGGTLEFAAGTGPNELPCPVFTPASTSAGKYLTGDMGQTFVDANMFFRVRAEAWFSTSTSGRVLMSVASPDASTRVVILLESGTGKLTMEKDQGGFGVQTYVWPTPNLADGVRHHMVYSEFTNDLYIDGVNYSLSSFNGSDLRMLTIGGYAGTRLWAGTIAHVAVYLRSVTALELAAHNTTGTTAHVGEAANVRMARLADYIGLPISTQGGVFDPMASQALLGSSALTHMREVETTESGKLIASRGEARLIFQSRDVRYNPTPSLSLAHSDLETDNVKLAHDDQKMVNAVTASRPGGATQRITSQSAVDTYGPKPRTLDLLKTTDNSVADAAHWLVSRYSDPPPEIRQVPVEAFTLPLATYRALLAADVSTVIGLTGLPSQAPGATATVVVEGYSERITQNQHHIDFHTSRAQTDSVWVLDDPTYSVLGSTTRLAY